MTLIRLLTAAVLTLAPLGAAAEKHGKTRDFDVAAQTAIADMDLGSATLQAFDFEAGAARPGLSLEGGEARTSGAHTWLADGRGIELSPYFLSKVAQAEIGTVETFDLDIEQVIDSIVSKAEWWTADGRGIELNSSPYLYHLAEASPGAVGMATLLYETATSWRGIAGGGAGSGAEYGGLEGVVSPMPFGMVGSNSF
jgi:hypothetical protein